MTDKNQKAPTEARASNVVLHVASSSFSRLDRAIASHHAPKRPPARYIIVASLSHHFAMRHGRIESVCAN